MITIIIMLGWAVTPGPVTDPVTGIAGAGAAAFTESPCKLVTDLKLPGCRGRRPPGPVRRSGRPAGLPRRTLTTDHSSLAAAETRPILQPRAGLGPLPSLRTVIVYKIQTMARHGRSSERLPMLASRLHVLVNSENYSFMIVSSALILRFINCWSNFRFTILQSEV